MTHRDAPATEPHAPMIGAAKTGDDHVDLILADFEAAIGRHDPRREAGVRDGSGEGEGEGEGDGDGSEAPGASAQEVLTRHIEAATAAHKRLQQRLSEPRG
ncbi:MAG: hypothetical protein WA962_04175 [Ornithinimicrobium sp.]